MVNYVILTTGAPKILNSDGLANPAHIHIPTAEASRFTIYVHNTNENPVVSVKFEGPNGLNRSESVSPHVMFGDRPKGANEDTSGLAVLKHASGADHVPHYKQLPEGMHTYNITTTLSDNTVLQQQFDIVVSAVVVPEEPEEPAPTPSPTPTPGCDRDWET